MKTVRRKFLAGVFVASFSMVPASMALPLEDNFEPGEGMSGTLGSLDGQNGWSVVSGSALVQNGVVYEGTQALALDQSAVGREIVSFADALWVSFRSYLTDVDIGVPDIDPDQNAAMFYVSAATNIVVISNSVPIELDMQVPLMQWVHFVVYYDSTEQSWGLSVDGTNAISGLPLGNVAESLVLKVGHDAETAGYIDNFLITEDEPAGLVADTDDDGLPDWWEQKNFAHPTAADASSDDDEDGNTLVQEYLAGLNPAVADQFVIAPLDSPGAFSWSTVPERLYDVYWTASLSNSFELISAGLPWTSNSFRHAEALDYEAGFYQLEVRPGW